MKTIALFIFSAACLLAQGRGGTSPFWQVIGQPQASAPGSCQGTGSIYLITDGTYRMCVASIIKNPFAGISGVTGTGTTNTFSLWTSSSAIGNANLTQNGTTGQLSASKSIAGPAPSPISFSATPTFDLSTCNRCEMAAMTANLTSVTFTNPTAGLHFSLTLLQDGTGGRTVTGYTVSGGSVTNTCTVSPTLNKRTTQEFEVASDGVTIRGLSCTSDDGPARDVQPSSGSAGQFATGINSTGAVTYGTPAGGSGGGIVVYSAGSLSLSGTQYIPIGGATAPSGTEANVQAGSPSAINVANMYVQLSVAPGVSNSVVVTLQRNGSGTTQTCTISGASATTCNDTTHTISPAQGDLLDYKIVTTGSVGTPNLTISNQFGTVTQLNNPATVVLMASVRSTSLTFPGASIAGDILAVACGWAAGANTNASVADTASTTYTRQAQLTGQTNENLAIFTGTVPSSPGTLTITCTYPSSAGFQGISAVELSNATATIDATAISTSGAGSTPISITLATLGDTVILASQGGSNAGVSTIPVPYLGLSASGNDAGGICVNISPLPVATLPASLTNSASNDAYVAIALKHP